MYNIYIYISILIILLIMIDNNNYYYIPPNSHRLPCCKNQCHHLHVFFPYLEFWDTAGDNHLRSILGLAPPTISIISIRFYPRKCQALHLPQITGSALLTWTNLSKMRRCAAERTRRMPGCRFLSVGLVLWCHVHQPWLGGWKPQTA